MKLHYYPDTDSLYIELSAKKSSQAKEISNGIVVDYDRRGNVIGIDIDHASKKIDLKSIETISLPTKHIKVA